MREKDRFSYIEVVTAVVVLGLVGMTVYPKFIEASGESRTGELIDGLQTVRAQLSLYRVQHKDLYPPTHSFEGFKSAMTTQIGQCGPYIRKIPVNPYNGLDTIRFDGEPAGANQAGWRFDTKTGLFQADNNAAYAAF
jgi:general secretion pathway protein G